MRVESFKNVNRILLEMNNEVVKAADFNYVQEYPPFRFLLKLF